MLQNKALLHAVPEVNFHFPRWKKKKELCVRSAPALKRVGEDPDVGFCSNTKVSLTFSALRWLLILVAFFRAAYGTMWPVDIYKLIWLRAMAFYKEKHLHMSHQNPVSTAHEHVIALNKHKSTFTGRESCRLTLPLKVSNYSIFWKLGNICSRSTGQLVSLKNWMKYWWGFITTLPGLPQLPPEGAHWCDQVKVCPHHNDSGWQPRIVLHIIHQPLG